MKRCSGCGELKALSAFHKNKGRKSGVNSRCKPCRAVVDHARYEAKVGTSLPRHPQRSERGRKAWLVSLKAGKPCTDCGRIFAHQVMQWDHLPGTQKLGELGGEFRTRTREEILTEIAKCDLVCTNCHAIRTFSRRGSLVRWLKEVWTLYAAASPDLAA